jgi:phage baseplate assembly protein W
MAEENNRSNRILSDYPGGASTIANKKGYSDLDLSLALHPFKKDIMPLKDDRAIKNSLKNLLNTDTFERPFQRNLGGNLRALLFEPINFLTETTMEDIISAIVKKEARVNILKISVKGNEVENKYDITIKFRIKENNEIQKLDIVLRRLR